MKADQIWWVCSHEAAKEQLLDGAYVKARHCIGAMLWDCSDPHTAEKGEKPHVGQRLSQAACLGVKVYMAQHLPWEEQPGSPLAGNLSALAEDEQSTSRE